jgi:hypothetical protein
MAAEPAGILGPVVSSVLWWLADAGLWAGETLAAPFVTGVAVALALRGVAIRGEVSDHDACAAQMNIDLTRWVADRERQLVREIARTLNLARQGRFEGVEPTPVPAELEGARPGSQVDSGAFVERVKWLMRQALHEYRDEVSRKSRAYRVMAQSERRFHKLLRRSRAVPQPLVLSSHNRETLATWRRREVPAHGTPTAEVKDDPTRTDDAAEIRAVEEERGLTWEAAKEPLPSPRKETG